MSVDNEYMESIASAKSNADFLKIFASKIKNKLQKEGNYLEGLANALKSKRLANESVIPEAPFLWTGALGLRTTLDPTSFYSRVIYSQRLIINSADEYNNYLSSTRSRFLNNHFSVNEREYLSPLFSACAILVFKNDQLTGAHLSIQRLRSHISHLEIYDVYGLNAEEVLVRCKGKSILIINSLQPISLWTEFGAFVELARKKNIKIVYYLHEGHETISKFVNENSNNYKKFIEGVDHEYFLTLGDEQNLAIKSLFKIKDNKKLFFQYNLSPEESFDGSLLDRKRYSNEKLVIIIGSIQPRKGIDFTKKLATEVARVDKDIKFIWLGNPNKFDQSYWRDMPENLYLLGNIGGFVKNDLINRSMALLMPSDSEPWSFAVSEALMFGVPVIYRPGRCGLMEQVRAKDLNGAECFAIEDINKQTIDKLLSFLLNKGTDGTPILYRRVRSLMSPSHYIYNLRRNLMSIMMGQEIPKIKQTNKNKNDTYNKVGILSGQPMYDKAWIQLFKEMP